MSKVHARYAADDVRFLPALQAALKTKFETLGHAERVTSECGALAEAAQQERDPDTIYRRVKGMHMLKPRKLAVLRALARLRELAARDHDVPPRTLIKDSVLLDMSRNPVTSIDTFSKIPGLIKRVATAYGEAIVTATREAMELSKDELPKPPEFAKETPHDQVHIDAINALAASLCYANRIAPSLGVNRKDISHLYFARQRGRELDACRLMQGWRREMIGGPIIEFLEGRAEMTMRWGEDGLDAELREPLQRE